MLNNRKLKPTGLSTMVTAQCFDGLSQTGLWLYKG